MRETGREAAFWLTVQTPQKRSALHALTCPLCDMRLGSIKPQGSHLLALEPRPSHEPFPRSPHRIHTAWKQRQCQTTMRCWECKTPGCRNESGSERCRDQRRSQLGLAHLPIQPCRCTSGILPASSTCSLLQYRFSKTSNSCPHGCWARRGSNTLLEDSKIGK